MSGLNQTQISELVQKYFEQRQARPGPAFTVHIRQQPEAITSADLVSDFIKRMNKARDSLQNPLKSDGQ